MERGIKLGSVLNEVYVTVFIVLRYFIGRASGDSPGFFPMTCTRYHRFTVTHPGNFTFDTCSSMLAMGFQLYKRTDNLSESEPRQ